MYRPNVSMIIYRKSDGKFLLVRKPREEHAWQFPQGGVDEGEAYGKAAKRELKEELGSDKFRGYLKSKHVLFYEFPSGYDRDGKYTGHKQSYYFVEFLGEDSEIELAQDELEEFRWVYQTELEEYLQSPEYLKKVQQVIYEFQDQL
jgi:putative (di)nucleoside polyphosphate hydrolase